jgi:hypothetical protein
MRKKFQALQKDIEEQREQLSLQHEQQKELYTTIKGASTLAALLDCRAAAFASTLANQVLTSLMCLQAYDSTLECTAGSCQSDAVD